MLTQQRRQLWITTSRLTAGLPAVCPPTTQSAWAAARLLGKNCRWSHWDFISSSWRVCWVGRCVLLPTWGRRWRYNSNWTPSELCEAWKWWTNQRNFRVRLFMIFQDTYMDEIKYTCASWIRERIGNYGSKQRGQIWGVFELHYMRQK